MPGANRRTRGDRRSGFTLVEIALVFAILGTLAAMATTRYLGFVERARVVRTVVEIRGMGREIDLLADEGELPATLAEAGHADATDPWGHAYRYLRLTSVKAGGGGPPAVSAPPGGAPDDASEPPGKPEDSGATGKARKDRFLVPINSDYDLYSVGPDGASLPPLGAPVSKDDVIRANDGAFVGLASDY